MTRYLTPAEVLTVHEAVMRRTGGQAGVRDVGLLESSVARPSSGFGETEFYPRLLQKAAVLLHSLINNHPFVDGNKRTAYVVMEVFLRLNRYILSATEEEKYDMVMAVATGRWSEPEIEMWLDAHTRLAKPQ